MSNLQEDETAGGMDGICYYLPALNLFPRVDSRSVRVTLTLLAYRSSFRDDQSSGGSLSVVGGIQRCGCIASSCTHTGERGHNNAVGECKAPQLQRFEKDGWFIGPSQLAFRFT